MPQNRLQNRRLYVALQMLFCGHMYHKTSFFMTAAMNIIFVGLIAKVLESLNRHAPVGYQDQSGFHFGVKKS